MNKNIIVKFTRTTSSTQIYFITHYVCVYKMPFLIACTFLIAYFTLPFWHRFSFYSFLCIISFIYLRLRLFFLLFCFCSCLDITVSFKLCFNGHRVLSFQYCIVFLNNIIRMLRLFISFLGLMTANVSYPFSLQDFIGSLWRWIPEDRKREMENVLCLFGCFVVCNRIVFNLNAIWKIYFTFVSL